MKKVGIIISFIFMLFISGCFKSKIPYIVSFDSNGGTFIEPVKTDGKSLFKMPEDPQLLGCEFDGWYFDNETFNNKFLENSFISNPLKEDVVLYAKYEIVEYNIKFYDGDVLVDLEPSTYTINDTVELPLLTKEGHMFLGWYDHPYDEFDSDELINHILKGSAGDKSFYAVIAKVVTPFSVTFKDEEEILKTEEVIEGENATPPAALGKDGYNFVGWDKDYNNITEDLVVNAIYEIINYDIKFYDDNNLLDLEPNSFTVLDLVDFPTPIKEGYDFIGWYDAEDLVDRIVNLFPGTTGNQSFYAKWEKIEDGDEEKIVVPEGAFTLEVQFGTVYGIKLGSNAPTASRLEYDWESSDESIAKISTYSTITPVSPGFTIISGTYKADPSLKGYILVKVEGTEVREADPNEIGKKIYHTVTFVDDLDNVVETQEVIEGMNATLPTPPKKVGKLFFGWDKSHVNVQNDITIKASYIDGDASFEGKKVTIIGSSSSTYYGTMPEGYAYFYPYSISGVGDVNQMWWAQIINKLGMQLLINNSYSATTVKSIGGKQTATEMDARLINSHVGSELPDYIFISMGLNDCRSGVSVEDFITAYNTMLSKLKILYPDAQIVLCTLTTGPYTTGYGDVDGYNAAIKQIAATNNFPLIDKELAINVDNYEDLIIDSVHPNTVGMDRLAEQGINDFLDYYGIQYKD